MKMHFYKSDISMKCFRCWNLDLQGSFYRDKLHCTNNRILQKVHVIEYCTTKLCVLICSLHYIFIIIKKAIFHFLFFLLIYIGKRKKLFQIAPLKIASGIVWNIDSNIFYLLPFWFRHQTKTFQIRNRDMVKKLLNVSVFGDLKVYWAISCFVTKPRNLESISIISSPDELVE